jgi:predicted thioesterase
MMNEIPQPGVTGETTFTVTEAHSTHVFGDQKRPPGRPAATDASPEERVHVLGTPHLLARVEFVGRESVRGMIPPGTGVVGERAAVTHRRAVLVGTTVRVKTELVEVDGRKLVFEGNFEEIERNTPIGSATAVLRIVDRTQFRDKLAD